MLRIDVKKFHKAVKAFNKDLFGSKSNIFFGIFCNLTNANILWTKNII